MSVRPVTSSRRTGHAPGRRSNETTEDQQTTLETKLQQGKQGKTKKYSGAPHAGGMAPLKLLRGRSGGRGENPGVVYPRPHTGERRALLHADQGLQRARRNKIRQQARLRRHAAETKLRPMSRLPPRQKKSMGNTMYARATNALAKLLHNAHLR